MIKQTWGSKTFNNDAGYESKYNFHHYMCITIIIFVCVIEFWLYIYSKLFLQFGTIQKI